MGDQAVEIFSNMQGLFAVPVMTLNFTDAVHEMNENLVSDIVKETERDPKGIVNSNFGGWHSKFFLEEDYESFNSLRNLVKGCANNYCDQFGWESGLECDGLWANINGPGDCNFPHQHNLSSLSAIYYPIGWIDGKETFYNYHDGSIELEPHACNGSDGGSISFFDPAHGKKVHLNPVRDEWHTVSSMHTYPTASLLILFPTYLIHSVNPFKEPDRKRISISFQFNYGPNRNSDSEESTE
jgi:hypothetical protein